MAVSLHGVLPPSNAGQQLIDIAIHQSPQVNGNSLQAVKPQPDEVRLLRSHQNLDQGAVPVVCASICSFLSSLRPDDIQMPSQKKIPRGFEIKNSFCPAPKSNALPPVSGANNSLELTPVHGDNVAHSDCNDHPSKRRKIAGSQTPPEVEEISPPLSFDPREAENYRIMRSDQYQGTGQEKGNRRTLNNGHSSRTSTSVDQAGSVQEYGNVEKMMKATKNSHRARKFIRLDQSQNSLDADPLNLAIEIEQQIGKRVTGYKYCGTARVIAQNPSDPTSKLRFNGLHENSEFSPHFIKRSNCQQQPADLHAPLGVPRVKRQRRASNQDGTHGRTRCLNKDFRPHDADLSGDELLGATTVGSNAGSHPSPPLNISYQDEDPEDLSTLKIASMIAPGLPPSIIPTSFNETKFSNKYSDLPAAKSGEKERRWSIDLNYANAGRKFEGEALGLVFDEGTECYHVYFNGQNLATTDLGYQIQPKKLQKVLFSNARVRFQSSKTQHADTVLDIRSNSERDVGELLKRLTHFGIEPQFSMKLDRIFAHRLTEQGKQGYCTDNTTEEPQKPWDLVSTPCQLNNIKSERQKHEIAIKQRSRLREKLESSSEASAQPKYRKILGAKSELIALADVKSRGTAKESPIKKSLTNPLSPYIASGFESEIEAIHLQSPLPEDSSAHLRLSIDEHSLASAWHSRPLVSPESTPIEWRDLLEARDLERLEDGEYLNDNLIEFYLKCLKNQLEQTSPETAKKVYFFNTFFFASLTRKGKRGINYDAVQKWTRSINIFSYDYVVVPICESQHWYVAIICNLPTLFKDRGIGESLPEDEPLQSPQADSFRDRCVELPAGSPDHKFGQTMALSVGEVGSPIREIDAPIENYPSKSFEDLSLEPCHGKPPELEVEPSAAHATNGHPDFGPSDQSLPDAQATKQVVKIAVHKEADSRPVELREKVTSEGCNLKAPTDKKKKQRPAPTKPRINSNIPLIITFDSLGLPHPHTNKALKDYLAAEGKAKRAIDLDTSQLKGITAKKIPHQENYYDCGLFLLGYIAKFLEGPKDFISKVIGQDYLDEDWATLIPRNLRSKIRAQIRTLLSDQERKERDSIAQAEWRYSQQRQFSKESSSLHITHPEETPLQAKHAEQASRTVIAPTRSPRMESSSLEGSLVQETELFRMNGHAREPSPSQDPAQPEMKPSHMAFVPVGHLHEAVSPTQNIAPGKNRSFETALPVHETETWQPPTVDTNYSTQRRGTQLSQDSPDPLHDHVIFVRGDSPTSLLESSTPPPREDSSISSDIHSSSLKYAEDCEQYSRYFPNDPDASIDRHTIIQDSQPTSVVDPLENQEVHQEELTPQRKRSSRSAPIIVEID